MKAGKRQTEITGTEREVDEELEGSIAGYVERMYRRKDLQQEEKHAKTALISEMAAKGIETYRYVDGDFEYTLTLDKVEKFKLKTKRVRLDDDGGEDGGEVIEFPSGDDGAGDDADGEADGEAAAGDDEGELDDWLGEEE